MSESSLPQVKLVLCDQTGLGRIRVDMEAFFDFSFSMAEELQDLIADQRHNMPARETIRAVRQQSNC